MNGIREGNLSQKGLNYLNTRVKKTFTNKNILTVVTTNKAVDEINTDNLRKLKGKKYQYLATIKDNFDQKSCLAEPELFLKVGCQIMFLVNNKNIFKNGDLGKVISLKNDEIVVELPNGKECVVDKYKWENQIYVWNNKTKKLTIEVVGSMEQYPIKLAYASTIHKLQGMQFDRLRFIPNRVFANGQVYVALSRCTSFEGLELISPLKMEQILVDSRVVNFMNIYSPRKYDIFWFSDRLLKGWFKQSKFYS